MSRIRSKGNLSTEERLRILLCAAKICGWRRHLPLPGKPDFAFPGHKLAIFVDGDFWHGRLERRPTTNPDYWKEKIARNQRRDKKINRTLRKRGWSVVRIWESDLKKKPAVCLRRIRRMLASASRPGAD